ncbi:phospholipase-like protein, partial [Tanacetum coccineum]
MPLSPFQYSFLKLTQQNLATEQLNKKLTCVQEIDSKVIITSKLNYFWLIYQKLDVRRRKLFRTTCFGRSLDIMYFDHEPQLIDYMLWKQHKVDEYHNDMPLIYYVEGHSLHFGRPEFALITGMRFGRPEFCSYTSTDLKFRNRVFPHKVGLVVTILDVLGVIEYEVMFGNLCDEDSVRLCLILALEVIFIGRLLTCPVDDSLFGLVENLEAWNVFPWGEHVWTQLYDSIKNVIVKHNDTHYLGLKKDRNYVPTYTLTGFVFAFQDSKTNTDIRPTRAEYESSWWIESNLEKSHKILASSFRESSSVRTRDSRLKTRRLTDRVIRELNVHVFKLETIIQVLALERNDKLEFNKDLSRLRGDFVESLNILFQELVDPHDSVEDIANEYLVDEELKLCLEEEERIHSEQEKRIQQEKRLRLEEEEMLRLEEEKMLQIAESDGYTVSRNFWLRLVCLDPCRKGWLSEEHIDMWVDYMWHGRRENANWAMASCYFVQLLMKYNMPLFYANGDMYGIPWSDVDQVLIPINETDQHWCPAHLDILSGLVTFYDSGDTYDYEWRDWYVIVRQCLELYLLTLLTNSILVKDMMVKLFEINNERDLRTVADTYAMCQQLHACCHEKREQMLEMQSFLHVSTSLVESYKLLEELQDFELEKCRDLMKSISETQLKVLKKLSFIAKLRRPTNEKPENYVIFEVNYDGVFNLHPLRYDHGKILTLKLSKLIRMSFSKLLDMLSYKLECEIWGIFYSTPRSSLEEGLTIVEDDFDMNKMYDMGEKYGLINLYIAHFPKNLAEYYYKNLSFDAADEDVFCKIKTHEKMMQNAGLMSPEELIAWEKEEAGSPLLRTPPLKRRRKGVEFPCKNLFGDFLHVDSVADELGLHDNWLYEGLSLDGPIDVGGQVCANLQVVLKKKKGRSMVKVTRKRKHQYYKKINRFRKVRGKRVSVEV